VQKNRFDSCSDRLGAHNYLPGQGIAISLFTRAGKYDQNLARFIFSVHKTVFSFLEIKDPGFSSQIDQVAACVQSHVRKEMFLVYLTSIGTGHSDADRNFIFYQIRQIIVRAIAGRRLLIKIPIGIRPHHTVIDKKQIYGVIFLVGNLGELKTTGRRLIIVSAQYIQKIRHANPSFCWSEKV